MQCLVCGVGGDVDCCFFGYCDGIGEFGEFFGRDCDGGCVGFDFVVDGYLVVDGEVVDFFVE